MIIVTPSGHTVAIKDEISYGDQRAIQRAIMSQMKFDQTQVDSHAGPTFSGAAIMDGQDAAIKQLVTKITFSDGGEVKQDAILETILSWKEEDAKFVYDAIDKLTRASQVPKVTGSN